MQNQLLHGTHHFSLPFHPPPGTDPPYLLSTPQLLWLPGKEFPVLSTPTPSKGETANLGPQPLLGITFPSRIMWLSRDWQSENGCQMQCGYLTCSRCLLLWELQRDCRHTERWQSSLALNKGLPRDCCHISEESSFYPWRWGWTLVRRGAREERGWGHGHPLLRPCKTVHILLLWCRYLWRAEVVPYISMHHQSLAQFLVHRWCWMDAENQNRTGWLTAPG